MGTQLNIVVLIKQVPDPSRNLRMTTEGSIDREKTPSVMNRYCKNAVEEALRLKDKHGGQITVLTMGPPKAELVLREAIAMGCDRGVLLTDRKLAGSDTWATAYALAKAVERISKDFGDYSIVFAGMQTTDGDTAHVGPQVAERLNVPVIAYCEGVELQKDSTLKVKRILEGGYQMLLIKRLPVVLTITGTGNEPREPTLKGFIRSKRAQILSWSVADVRADENRVGLRGSPTVVYEVKKVEYTRPPCKMIRGTPGEAVNELYAKMAADNATGVLG